MLPERDCQDDCVGLECIPQRLSDDRGSNRPSLRRQRLGRPAARDGHLDVLTGEGPSESLAYRTESYNRIAHNTLRSVLILIPRPFRWPTSRRRQTTPPHSRSSNRLKQETARPPQFPQDDPSFPVGSRIRTSASPPR